jgi:hypothetical protein
LPSVMSIPGGESLVARVDGYRSVLNAYDTGREAETLLSSSDRSEGSQWAPRGGESLVTRPLIAVILPPCARYQQRSVKQVF